MAVGFPTKANWAAGDVLTASALDDLAGTVNLLNPTAKGNLISASAANTVALLAVGTDGQQLIADSSTSTGLRYNPQNALANPVINGGLDIWSRGVTGTANSLSPGSGYNADRWQNYSAGNAITVSRQVTNDTTNLPNIQYCARVQRNSGQTSTSVVQMAQSLESVNSIPFVGKVVTFSFYARAGANFSGTNLVPNLYANTGTDQNVISTFSAYNPVSTTPVTLTTTWQRFVGTGTVPTSTTQLGIQTLYTPTGTAGANDYFEITGFQIDFGTYTATTAPAFRRSQGTIQGESAACQRYYIRLGNTSGNSNQRLGNGMAVNTTTASTTYFLPVKLRVVASSIDYSTLQVYDGVTTYAATSATLNAASDLAPNVNIGVAAGLTTKQFYEVTTASNSAGYIAFNAEL